VCLLYRDLIYSTLFIQPIFITTYFTFPVARKYLPLPLPTRHITTEVCSEVKWVNKRKITEENVGDTIRVIVLSDVVLFTRTVDSNMVLGNTNKVNALMYPPVPLGSISARENAFMKGNFL
jgi:hypothetical protein